MIIRDENELNVYHRFLSHLFAVCFDELVKQTLANDSELGETMKPYAERGVTSKCAQYIYLIPIEIRAPLNFAPSIFAPLISAHPQISRPSNFCASLFYCKFAVFLFIRGSLSTPLNFRAG